MRRTVFVLSTVLLGAASSWAGVGPAWASPGIGTPRDFPARATFYLTRYDGASVGLIRGRVVELHTGFSDLYKHKFPHSPLLPFTKATVAVDTVYTGDFTGNRVSLVSFTAVYKSEGQPMVFRATPDDLPRFLKGDQVLVLLRGHEKDSSLLADPEFANTYLPVDVRFVREDSLGSESLYKRRMPPSLEASVSGTPVFDVAPDGRFLVVRQAPLPPVTRLEVVLDWVTELRRRAGTVLDAPGAGE